MYFIKYEIGTATTFANGNETIEIMNTTSPATVIMLATDKTSIFVKSDITDIVLK